MRITRKKLQVLIREAIFPTIRSYRSFEDDAIESEADERLKDLARAEDISNVALGNELAQSMGYEGRYSDDVKAYELEMERDEILYEFEKRKEEIREWAFSLERETNIGRRAFVNFNGVIGETFWMVEPVINSRGDVEPHGIYKNKDKIPDEIIGIIYEFWGRFYDVKKYDFLADVAEVMGCDYIKDHSLRDPYYHKLMKIEEYRKLF